MAQPVSYSLAVRRALFIILIAGLVILPHVTLPNPRPPFDMLKSALTLPLPLYIGIGIGALILLLILRGVRERQRPTPIQPGDSAAIAHAVLTSPIEHAVSGIMLGDGLKTRAVALKFKWIVLGWVTVQTPKLECVIIDQRVIYKTQWIFMPLMLLGKPVYARRVLLKPVVLSLRNVNDLTTDRERWRVHLDVDLIYSMSDPRRALVEAPLSTFSSLIQGEISKYIRTVTQAALLEDKGDISATLHMRLNQSEVLRGLKIEEVIVIAIRGDERVIEIERETAVENARLNLIVVQGQGRLLEAQYNLKIEEMRLHVTEWAASQAHAREKELLIASLENANLQTIIQVVGQIAAAGINPSGIWADFRQVMGRTPFPVKDEALPPGESLLEKERRLLKDNQQVIGYKRFQVDPHPQHADRPGRAVLDFATFALIIQCPDTYPATAPNIELRLSKEDRRAITLPAYDRQGGLTGVTITSIVQAGSYINQSKS